MQTESFVVYAGQGQRREKKGYCLTTHPAFTSSSAAI
jgi:hypothetical protein